jgi:hypothetical protein
VAQDVRGTWASLGGAGEVSGRVVLPDVVLELGRASELDLDTEGRRSGGGVSLARGGVLKLDRVVTLRCRAAALGGTAA